MTNLVYLLQHEQKVESGGDAVPGHGQRGTHADCADYQPIVDLPSRVANPIEVDLNEVLDSVLVLFSPQIKQNHIRVDKRFETHSERARIPRGTAAGVFQLGGQRDRGNFDTEATRAAYARIEPGVGSRAKGIRITVLDRDGIPRGVRKNLFAPFYTTKGEKGQDWDLDQPGYCRETRGDDPRQQHQSQRPQWNGFSVFLPFEQELGLLDAE